MQKYKHIFVSAPTKAWIFNAIIYRALFSVQRFEMREDNHCLNFHKTFRVILYSVD
jgi:hypothetical protein